MGTILGDGTIQELRESIGGEVITPADPGYDEARAVWNGMVDKRPALIVRCSGVADVLAAVQFARSQDLEIAVRGGGHSLPGFSTTDGGIVVDLSPMKGIRVDPEGQRVVAQAGVTWREMDHETQAFGLAVTGGLISSTGIAGFTLGGGIGWLMRKHGLTCDNVLRFELVTADGIAVAVDADHQPELFWALRGGGGNFGVVTAFEYALHDVTTVFGGIVIHPAERARELLSFWDRFVEDTPDELATVAAFLSAPAAPFIPEHLQGRSVVAIVGCFAGDLAAGERAIQPLRRFGPPDVDLFGPMPYVAVQSMLDAGAPAGIRAYWKSGDLHHLGEGQIETIVAHARAAASPLTQIHLHQMGGAVARVAPGATAFGHRQARYVLNIVAGWTDRQDDVANVRWARDFWTAIAPDTDGAYVNFLGADDDGRLGAAYDAATISRLRAVKAAWDPDNVFRLNVNIPPKVG